jgi:RNA polymerase sigma-70 factor, ECF subfamily
MSGRPYDDRTDGEIIARVRAGDREAFRVIVVRYQDLLYRHAWRMTSDVDAAEDLVQGAFVKAFADIRSCKDTEHFGGWLFRILSNACKDHLKSHAQRSVTFEDVEGTLSSGRRDALAEVEEKETGMLLRNALGKLPAGLREAFVLKHQEGHSYEEMAELLGSSVPALKMRVHRAREALHAMLEAVIQ